MRCARWGWGGVALLALGAAQGLPAYDEATAQSLGHVTVVATPDSDARLVKAFGDIAEAAAAVYEQELKLKPPANLRLCVSLAHRAQSTIITDRRSRVFINYLPPERGAYLFMADYNARQAGPVHALCRAVAELHNPHRIPGMEQLLASKYAVPAVLDQLGAKTWPTAYEIDGRDGERSYQERAAQPAYLQQHPRWAAAVALQTAIEQLKPEAFAKTLAALKGEGPPALAMLRKLLVAQAPALDAAFADYDRAVDLPLEADGSLLLTSFENAEQCQVWRHYVGCQLAVSTEWAKDGKRSASLTFAQHPWARAVRLDPDWRYADWSAFGSLEFDVKNPADQPLRFQVEISDDESGGHGSITRVFTLPANGEQHCSVSLVDPALQRPYFGIYYDGQVRLSEIGMFEFTVPDEHAAPVVLQVDNVRLKP